MTKLLTFNTAVIIVVVLGGLALINKSFSMPYAGLLLVFLVLASIVPVVMVPVGLMVVLWNVLQPGSGIGTWIASFTSKAGTKKP